MAFFVANRAKSSLDHELRSWLDAGVTCGPVCCSPTTMLVKPGFSHTGTLAKPVKKLCRDPVSEKTN